MGRCSVQIVMGPAGSGKSTYCHTIRQHCATIGKGRGGRSVHVANLDPAAEGVPYDEVAFDIRDLIAVDEVMDELGLGPNGALVYCMEYLLENVNWLREEMDSYGDDEYLILDCPGQVELYTHVPVMRRVVDQMRMWGYESSMVSVFVVDATFVCDASKFISGTLLSLSAMIAMELPHVNVLSKCDLVDKERVEEVLDIDSASQLWNMEEHRAEAEERLALSAKPNRAVVRLNNTYDLNEFPISILPSRESPIDEEEQQARRDRQRKKSRLTEAICSLVDDYAMVGFQPLDITDEDSIDAVLAHVDHTIQYGENTEVRDQDYDLGMGDAPGSED